MKPSMPHCPTCNEYGHYPSQHVTTAAEVQVGDTLDWCDRQITVLQIQRTNKKRTGRWFTVKLDDRHARLHWFDDEPVRLIDGQVARNLSEEAGSDG